MNQTTSVAEASKQAGQSGANYGTWNSYCWRYEVIVHDKHVGVVYREAIRQIDDVFARRRQEVLADVDSLAQREALR
jgi:hypothetical protein